MNPTIPSSSNTHDDASIQIGTFKKRRVQRACDMCRKRKIKCTGGENAGESCVNCRVYKWACTFGDPGKNDTPSKSPGEPPAEDGKSVKTRTCPSGMLESVPSSPTPSPSPAYTQLCPDESLLRELQKHFLDADSASLPLPEESASASTTTSASKSTFRFKPSASDARTTKTATHPLDDISTLLRSRAAESGPESVLGPMAQSVRQVGRGGTPPSAYTHHYASRTQEHAADLKAGAGKQGEDGEGEGGYESEDDASHVLASTLRNLHLEPQEYRFFGKSSGAMLIRRAMEMKSEFVKQSSNSNFSPASASTSLSPSMASGMVASARDTAPVGGASASPSRYVQERSLDSIFVPVPAAAPSTTCTSTSTAPGQTPPSRRRGALPIPPTMKNLRPEFWLPTPWELRANLNGRSRPSSSATSAAATPASTTAYSPPISSPSMFTSSPSPSPLDSTSMHHHAQGSSTSTPDSAFDLPPPDLARALIELYFANMNLFFPLLHRPTFDRLVARGGFLSPSPLPGAGGEERERRGEETETGFRFAHVYLLVCAVGAYFSDDARCLLDAGDVGGYGDPEQAASGVGAGSERAGRAESERGAAGAGLRYSGGWKWFDQVQMSSRSLIAPPALYDLQVYALSAQFLQGSSAPQSAWTMCGIGIRLAQDVGAHRRGHYTDGRGPTKEGELWKKAFWVLVIMDRMFSSSLGRSCAIQDEDFDLDPPVDCDDDFWDTKNPDPQKRFKQPPRKPSLMTHFLLSIELTHIMTFSMRTIYSINKSQVLCGLIGPDWEQTVVSELDSALNKWADAVPDHLKWDPHREDVAFFHQSAALWATYYHVQILVHRPFIQSPSRGSSVSMIPSLAMCTNAARACCHIVDVQQRRTGPVIAHVQMAIFQSALILLLSIWGGKRSGLLIDPSPQMADVRKCMQILKASEERWFAVGRLNDVLSELASVGELPLPGSQPQTPLTRNKRQHEQDRDHDHPTETSAWTPSTASSLYTAESDLSAADEQLLSTISMSATPSQMSFDTSLFNSMAYAPILPAAAALPDIDFTRYTIPFTAINSNADAPAGHNFQHDVADAAAQNNYDTGSQSVIHEQQFASFPNTYQVPLGPIEQNAHEGNDFSMGYLGQTFQDTDSATDMWMNATAGIDLEELGAYLSNLDALTQNALGGSGMGWSGNNTGYQRYSS
ncbi:hypothetical protein D9619_013325 [Psilocybe cf. subviscida]|uniref:Zn(2)-C6 fungal-type domain-containing protein n=1 Tax=Psilocybe cf. subviscida TaxID=2480587 RepID=A0A8H5BU33_9AGAR|nr:hypothetical protein D9619_013325 [Psilocybe cf. subviscida]